MFKVLTIGGKEYHLEYSIEASLYEDATQKVMDFMLDASNAASASDEENATEAIKESFRTMTNVPKIALTLFYAGLLEHHGPFGDNTVHNLADAKRIIRDYMIEHDEDGTGTWYDIMTLCLDQMGEDGFFKRIGLDKMMQAEPVETKPNRAQRRAAAKKAPTEN